MTREEAEEVAKSMPRLKALVKVRNDIDGAKCIGIDLLLEGGQAIGIGNPEAIKAAMATLVELLDRQIEKERGNSPTQSGDTK